MIATETTHAPRKVVHQDSCLRLYRFASPLSPEGGEGRGEGAPPVVLVYSFINRPAILDLLPQRSVVRSLLGAGHDVYLADWGDPGALEASLDLEGHLGRLERALRAAATLSGSERVSLLGYCLGGTVALLMGARSPALVDRIGLLATPVVFEKGGTLALWAQTPTLDPSKLALTRAGNVPGELLREMFRWLDPVGQGKKWLTLAENWQDPAFLEGFLAIERWSNGCVDFPGRLFDELLTKLYREDRLARGELAPLSSLRMPILNVVAHGDNVVPDAASLPLALLVGSGRVETLRVPGGHIGMTIGKKALQTTHAALARFFGSQT